MFLNFIFTYDFFPFKTRLRKRNVTLHLHNKCMWHLLYLIICYVIYMSYISNVIEIWIDFITSYYIQHQPFRSFVASFLRWLCSHFDMCLNSRLLFFSCLLCKTAGTCSPVVVVVLLAIYCYMFTIFSLV